MLPTDRSLSFINCVVWEGAQSKRSQLVGLVCPMSTLYVCERVHFLFFLSFPSLFLFFFFSYVYEVDLSGIEVCVGHSA